MSKGYITLKDGVWEQAVLQGQPPVFQLEDINEDWATTVEVFVHDPVAWTPLPWLFTSVGTMFIEILPEGEGKP